nr:MAG TPA: hypothetical protein [Caudoviricetes sp.]
MHLIARGRFYGTETGAGRAAGRRAARRSGGGGYRQHRCN